MVFAGKHGGLRLAMHSGSLKKILHILDHSLPLHSGYSFRSHDLLRAQQLRGWTPMALTSPKHEESWKQPGIDVECIGGVSYHRTGQVQRRGVPLLSEAELVLVLTRRLLDKAQAERPHVLHAHSPVLNALPALWVGKRLKIPVVYEVRAFWEDAAVDHGTYAQGSWKYSLARAMETWACRRAAHVAVLCQGIRTDLLARNIDRHKITIVPNSIYPADFQPCEPDEEYRRLWNLQGKRVISFIGSFYKYEGLDLLIDAFAELRKRHANVRLLLVGGGEMESALKAKAAELSLGQSVLLPGRIPHHRIPGVYALSDMLVYPRYSMRLTELVTPLKPIEAMSMGRVVVASDVGGHKEHIRDNDTGLLFKAGNRASLVHAMERVLMDAELYLRIARTGQQWVWQERSWDSTIQAYTEIYSTVCL